MMWRRSLRRPALAGLPAASHCSRLWPPFQARVVNPRISTLTPQRSSVRARMSALIAATVIGRPRIEPELSISSDTTVSRKVGELLVEVVAQAAELLGVAQMIGLDDLVELDRIGVILLAERLVAERARRQPRTLGAARLFLVA